MTSRTATRGRARTWLLTVSVACTVGLVAGSTVQPVAANPIHSSASVRDDRAASPVAATGSGEDPGSQLQKMLLKFAAEKIAGFAFGQLGLGKLLEDKTGAKLDELKAQLEQVSIQLRVLQESLNQISSDLAKLALEGFTVPLGVTVSNIKSTYTDFYVPTLNALTTYVSLDHQANADSKTCDDVPACKTARDHFDALRLEFNKQFTPEGPAGYNIVIHDALLPGAAGNSAMVAFGLFLAKNGPGFLTAADSEAILKFYHYFADYEALASWMKAQWNGYRFALDPAEFDRFLTEQVFGFQDAEHAALPPRIPANTVIALPADAALRMNTFNLPMWGFNNQAGALTFWDPFRTVAGVPENIRQMNTTAAGYGYTDWKVPTRNELNALLSRGPATKTARDFLLSLDPTWPALLGPALTGAPYIWTTQGAGIPSWKGSPAIGCENFNGAAFVPVTSFTDYMHTAVGPVTNSLSGFPAQFQNNNRPDLGIGKIQTTLKPPSTVQDIINRCRTILDNDITVALSSPTATATVLATRNTGDVNYLP